MSKLNNQNIKDLLAKTTVDMDLEQEWREIASRIDNDGRNRKGLWWIVGIMLIAIVTILWILLESKTLTHLNNKAHLSNQISYSNTLNQVNEQDLMSVKSVNNTKLSQPNLTSIDGEVIDEDIVNSSSIKVADVTASNIESKNDLNNNKEEISFTNSIQQTETVGNMLKEKLLGKQSLITLSEHRAKDQQSFLESSEQALLDKKEQRFTNLKELPVLNNRVQPTITLTTMPFIKPLDLKKSILESKYFIYTDFAFFTVNDQIDKRNNIDYASTLDNDYKALSKLESGIGIGRQINQKWSVNFGLRYDQYRSVYRGQVIRQKTDLVKKDSAHVFVNSLGGTVYKEGEVLRTTITTSVIQQYNYQHQFGFVVGSRYNFYGPFYLGADIHWRPIHWQSGLMVNSFEEITELKEVVTNTSKLNIGLDLGFNMNISKHLGIQSAIRFQPSQFSLALNNVNLSNQILGGQIRLIYRM